MFVAEQLLNPIHADQPCGADLSFAPELDAIAKARVADDPTLDQGEWVTDLKEADWEFVVARCTSLLEQKSKDLRLAVWLAEAGAKRHRMRGLAEGMRVLAGLLEQFWDHGLFPEADGDDHERRVGNLSWILARIPALLREMPVTDGNGSRYCLIDFEMARKNPNNPDLKLVDMDSAKRASSAKFRADFAADATYCLDAIMQLERVADARLGDDSPGFSAAREAIKTMQALMPVSACVAQPQAGEIDQDMAHMAAPVRSGAPGALHTRADAIAQLRAVAEYFRRTEPHSPVSYFADKAANAGEQDLHEWLRSVVKDPGSLSHIEELLGVKAP
ncbi:MAG: type VI secretion system protein TssA [Pseudomonadota bacterium]